MSTSQSEISSALVWLVRDYHDIEAIAAAINSGADVNTMDSKGHSVLAVATITCYHDAMKLLLEHGADPDVRTRSCHFATPLHIACCRDDEWAMRCLLEYGANPNIPDDLDQTPGFVAAAGGKDAILQLLLEGGFRLEAKQKHPPLVAAAINGYLSTVQLLLNKGADPNQGDYDDWTPLHAACDSGFIEIVELLYGLGARINAIDSAVNSTPLHAAAHCEDDHTDIVSFLIMNGADVHARTKDGTTAYLTAYKKHNYGICRLLEIAGADPIRTKIYIAHEELIVVPPPKILIP